MPAAIAVRSHTLRRVTRAEAIAAAAMLTGAALAMLPVMIGLTLFAVIAAVTGRRG